MKQKQPKFYVVWKGKTTGIFTTWDECKAQIHGVYGAVYKSFPSKEHAEEAYIGNSAEFIGKPTEFRTTLSEADIVRIGLPIQESIAVDGAWNTQTGIIEYQAVKVSSGEKVFHAGPFEDGTNNIAEFLALVHALAYCKLNGITMPIYSDSRTAISWVRKKVAKTKLTPSPENEKLFNLIERAIKWLKGNTYTNDVLKWQTIAWGENPADFGRK